MQGGSLSDWLLSLSVPATAVGTILVMLTGAGIGNSSAGSNAEAQREEKDPSHRWRGRLPPRRLGLLGLLLAFSRNGLESLRGGRELVTTEANAIGTAYLRSQLLDEPYRSRLSNLLMLIRKTAKPGVERRDR
jgi:hypothetical protein